MSPQQTIAHYRIDAKLGEGGMGEVWRATDTKLRREVAIKILPAAFARHPDRMARFRREAQVLASLNHPNIAAIYGLEDSAPPVALVMELVAGAPLSSKIRARGMPLEQVLKLAIQIAAGLEAAHKASVVHRDLKPSNIMVTPEGGVKLLDFGLAKFLECENLHPDETQTIGSVPQTEEGCIVGTVAYMSPEQASAKAVDARSDIFSFGIVLFEMLTGKRPFEGDNKMLTLASLLREEPKRPSEMTSPPLPREVERIVLRCLRKDPDRRFQTIADLRLALEDLSEDLLLRPPAETSPSHRPAVWPRWAALSIALAAALAFGLVWLLRPLPHTVTSPRQVTFEAGIAQEPALSPDGKLLAYVSDRGGEGEMDIWLKQVAGGNPVRLTSGPGSKSFLQFSADGTSIFYLSGGDLFEVPALGGPSRRVRTQVGLAYDLSSRGEIVCYRPATANAPSPILILPVENGPPEIWHPECRSIVVPAWSPDGDRLAFWGDCSGRSDVEKVNLFVAPRRGGSVKAIGGREERIVAGRIAWFSPHRGSEAVVLSLRSGDSINLFRIGLDGTRQSVTVGAGSEKMPSISRTGDLAFSRSDDTPEIWSVPLDDLAQKPFREAAPAQGFAISNDGTRLVFGRMLGPIRGELVMRDRSTGAETVLASHQLVAEGAGSLWPQFSPDGSRIVYRAYTDLFGSYAVSTEGGAPRLLIPASKLHLASDWSRDGKQIIGECAPVTDGLCEADSATGATHALLKDPNGGLLLYPSFSWDQKWVTFMLRRAGHTAIFATPAHSDGTLAGEASWVRISPENAEATRPHFSPDGASIFYAFVRKTIMEVVRQRVDPVTRKPIGPPAKVASAPFSGPGQFIIAVSSDRLFFNTDEIRSNIWMTRMQ